MASESSENLPQKAPAARRTDTPPRSIFDDYHTAYQSILSPGRNVTGAPRAVTEVTTPHGSSGLSQPDNPFAGLSPPTHIPRNPSHGIRTGSAAAIQHRHKSRQPRSPKSKRRTNFSRPISVSPASEEVARPDSLVVPDSISIFDLGSPRRLNGQRSVNTKQPNLHGARGRVEKSSTIGSIVNRYGDQPDPHGENAETDQNVGFRSSFEIMGCGQGVREPPSVGLTSSPAGQAPTIPLPPDPSFVAARGLTGEMLSEGSLYENTEKLLNLTQTSGTGALARQTGPARLYQSADNPEGRLNSEFSWMGNKGMISFRDLSVKEMKLRKSIHGQPGDLDNEVVDTPPDDEPYGDQDLLSEAVYQSLNANQRSNTHDELVKADARQTKFLSEHPTLHWFEMGPKRTGESVVVNEKKSNASACVGRDPQTDSVLDFGGLQSSSSYGVSLETDLRDGPFRPGLYMDESSLASLIGRESADVARLSAIERGKNVIRSVEDDAENDLCTEGGETEGGEWVTMDESRMHSKMGTQTSIGRDTSGSSLANVSSNQSTEDDRSAPVPWDPLRSHPTFITPPSKVVIHPRNRNISGVQEPATVPRYAPLVAEGHPEQKLRRTFSSTPALTLSATPQHQRKRQKSPTYRHPAPLGREHQNPFSSPPPVGIQVPGASFELTEFNNKRADKRQAIYADSSRSLHQQIHKPAFEKTKSQLTNPSARQDTSSEQTTDGSYSTTYPTNLAVDGTSILNPNSPHTPKSTKSYTRGSVKGTKQYCTASPRCMIARIHLHCGANLHI
jgi:hypothetical protein